MIRRCFVFAFLTIVSSGVVANDRPENIPESDLSKPLSGLDALVRFNSTEKYLDKARSNDSASDQLMSDCSSGLVRKCISHLKQNMRKIPAKLPDNPEYWRAFHDLVNGQALELDLSPDAFSNPEKDRGTLIFAAQNWLYLSIAENEVSETTKQFVAYYASVRRHLSESESLGDRMIFVALVGIAHSQSEVLMALNAAEDKLGGTRALARALTPFTQQELSLRRVLEAEALYLQASIDNMEKSELELASFAYNPNIPNGSVEELRQWAKTVGQLEWEKFTAFLGEVTERNWSTYWGQGYSHLESEFPESEYVTLNEISTYKSYAESIRHAEVVIYPLLALSDIYLGRSSSGLPGRAAPPYWNWSWRAETQEVCLVPTHVAPNTTDYSVESPACMTYVSDTSN